MYKKLDISLSELDFDKLKGSSSFGYPTFREFSVIDTDYLFDTLSKQVTFDVMPTVNITEIKYPGATAHTDTWPSAINFYFDVGDDETFFWKEINVSPNTKQGLVFYDPKNLTLVGSFKANKGDCYLLDVGNSIHSVKMYTPNTTRQILRLYWQELSFDQVLQNLKFS